MDREKARIRLEHWLKHAEEHALEYQEFSKTLHQMGFKKAGDAIMRLSEITKESCKSIQEALEGLKEE
jgi:hypothetical protein